MSNFDANRVTALLTALRPDRLTRIMDIGANPIHRAPYSDLLALGGCEVWGFEPQEEAHKDLVSAAGPNEHYSPHAVGDGKTHQLHICKSDGFSSLLRPNRRALDFLERWHKAMSVDRQVPVETKRLDDIADIPSPDLVKIDVQGAEDMIFRNAAEKMSSSVAVITEVAFVPLYENQPLFHRQAATLERYGFYLSKFHSLKKKSFGNALMKHVNWRRHQGQLIDGDAVFVKSKGGLLDLDDEQLKHLAICADAVFESFDLTLKCLTILLDRGAIHRDAAMAYIGQVPHPRA